MGMYSEIVNHCAKAGPHAVGYLQTKDLECIFDFYWVAPDGCMYKVDWPTSLNDGKCGRVRPFCFTGYIQVVDRILERVDLKFVDGKLISSMPVNRTRAFGVQ